MWTRRKRSRAGSRSARLLLSGATAAAVLTAGQLPASSAVPEGRWVSVGRLSVARNHQTSTLLRNGKVLVAGGRTDEASANAPLTTSELFDPLTARFTPTGTMTTARWRHTATLLPNGKVLVAGGFTRPYGPGANAQPVTDTAELYDPATGSWSTTGTMITRHALAAAVLLPNGKVLVAGGRTCNAAPPVACNFTFRSNAAELYDPATGAWTATGPMNEARHTTDAALLANGKVLVPAGFTNAGNGINGDLYDPAAGSWTLTGNLTQDRARQGALLLPNGKVLADAGFPLRATAELYDPTSNTWALTGNPLLAGRFNYYEAVLPNGKAITAGGGPGSPRRSAELFDPASGTWTAAPDMTTEHGTTSSLGNTERAVVLSASADRLINDPAVCSNRCGGVLVIGNNPTGAVDLYIGGCIPVSRRGDQRFPCVPNQ